MKLSLKYCFTLLLLLAFARLQAQVQFEMVVSAKEIGKRDEVQVEYIVSGANKITDFRLPYFEKWTVVSGPSSSTQVYVVDGKKSSMFKYVYVVSPASTGRLGLPGTTVSADGRMIRCKGVVINVKKQDHVDASGSAVYSQPQADLVIDDGSGAEDFKEYDLKPGEDPMKKIRSNLFVKAVPSKNRCYVGEPVLVTYKLYTRLRSNSRVMKQPAFSGCSVSEMTTTDMKAVVETVNGKKYNTYIFRRVQLTPLQPGRITAGMATVDNTVTFIEGGADLRRLYYGLEAGNSYDVSMSTEPFSIEVVPLPANAKSAAVGRFEIFTELKKDSIAANETNTLIVTIAGTGNFKSVEAPEIQWPAQLYHFDAVETDEVDKLSFPTVGRKVFEIPFEASTTGSVGLDPVAFSYFDPASGKYATVQSKPLRLTVTPAVKTSIQHSIASGAEQTGINYLLYLLPVVFLLGAVVIWKMPRKRMTGTIADYETGPSSTEAGVQYDVSAKMDELVLVQDDTAFYSAARELAKDLIAIGKGDHDLLLAVLQDCNTVLYTPIASTSRKEILEKLRAAIG